MWLMQSRLPCARFQDTRAASVRSERLSCPPLALAARSGLAGEDLGQPVDVHLVEHALASRLLQPRLQLCAQKVDPAVENPPSVRDLLLLFGEVLDQLLEIVVGERVERGKGFHGEPFVGEESDPSLRRRRSKGQLQLETLAVVPV